MLQQWLSIRADHWAVQPDAAAICAALDSRGEKESVLLQRLQSAYGLPAVDSPKPRASKKQKK